MHSQKSNYAALFPISCAVSFLGIFFPIFCMVSLQWIIASFNVVGRAEFPGSLQPQVKSYSLTGSATRHPVLTLRKQAHTFLHHSTHKLKNASTYTVQIPHFWVQMYFTIFFADHRVYRRYTFNCFDFFYDTFPCQKNIRTTNFQTKAPKTILKN
jgi:hypothetical protein